LNSALPNTTNKVRYYLLPIVHIGSGAHPASYQMGNMVLSWQ